MAHEILIVDDEPDIRALIEGILSDEGYETRQAHNSDAALAAFRARRPSLVILDIWLQNSRLDGLGILNAMHGEEPQVPCVIQVRKRGLPPLLRLLRLHPPAKGLAKLKLLCFLWLIPLRNE